ncbi:hypothetical protein [Aerosakkonema sp. BLCC-F183]
MNVRLIHENLKLDGRDAHPTRELSQPPGRLGHPKTPEPIHSKHFNE